MKDIQSFVCLKYKQSIHHIAIEALSRSLINKNLAYLLIKLAILKANLDGLRKTVAETNSQFITLLIYFD